MAIADRLATSTDFPIRAERYQKMLPVGIILWCYLWRKQSFLCVFNLFTKPRVQERESVAGGVSASGPKQHRPSDGRPLQRWFEFQRHHPPEGCCRGYIFVLWVQSCWRTTAILYDTLSIPWYIIDILSLFEYLYICFERTVSALYVCLIILQDTSELPMCLRLVATIPSWYAQVYSKYAVLWLLVFGRQCDLLSPEWHLLFPEQGVFGFCRNCWTDGAGWTSQEGHQVLAGTSSRNSDNLEKDGQRCCFASSTVWAEEQHQRLQSLRVGVSRLCTVGQWTYSGADDVRAVSDIQFGLSGLFCSWWRIAQVAFQVDSVRNEHTGCWVSSRLESLDVAATQG